MRVCVAVMASAVLGLIVPDGASADFVHVVVPGESLSSIAAADGLSVGALAAANGLSPDAQLVAGTGVQIPAQSGAGPAPAAPQSVAGDGDGDSDDPAAAGPAGPPTAAPVTSSSAAGGDGDNDSDDVAQGTVASSASGQAAAGAGTYVVQPGDTLSAIAARAGMSVADLAATNGLDPAAPLLSGSVLRLGGGPASSAQPTSATAAGQPVGAAAEGSPVGPPYPTPQAVAPSQVGSIAAANGVPPSLADAIAYQESGFNNAAVSPADARGVMQILPGTWDWIQRTLVAGAPPLAPASATDNIRGGVLLLRSLLNSTGGNPALAAAGYYQGLPSVEQNGMYPSTQQYVNDVMALAQRFGGG
jgi:LysM repeat protein